MKLFLKIVAGILVASMLLIGGCALLVGGAANQASKDIASSTKHYNASAKAFRVKFAQVKVGDTFSGKGGSTIAQVNALLGKPDVGDITVTQSGGLKLVSYGYHFYQADGSPSWNISFTNGRVSDKSSL